MANTNNKFLDTTGLTYLISKIKTADNANINKIYVGSCSTTASSQNKVATAETFPTVAYDDNGTTKYKPVTGTVVAIKYSVSNTCKLAGITLNVNNTGAWPFYYNNAQLAEVSTANTAVAGYKNRYIYYMFNGTQWVWLTGSYDANSTYSAMTQAEIDAGTSTTGRTMTPQRLCENFLKKYIMTLQEFTTLVFGPEENQTDFNTLCEKLLTKTQNNYAILLQGDTLLYPLTTGWDSNESKLTIGYLEPVAGTMATFVLTKGTNDDWSIVASTKELVGSSELATVATSGDYDDLSNKPTIPTVPTFKTINSEAITGSGDIALQTPLTFDSTPTANSTNPVTSGGIKTAIDNATELHVVPTQGTGLLFYAAAGYIIDQSQINTTCEGILTALKNGKKLYFELDNRADGGAKETYSAVYADYVEPENESTVINIIANHSLLAFYKVTLTKAYGATNWVITYVNKIAQEKPDVVNVEGSGNAVTNWSVNGDVITLTKGLTFQEELVSGTSIKTINNTSLLGSGDISVQAPLTFDSTPTANSTNPVTSGGIKTELDKKADKVIELLRYNIIRKFLAGEYNTATEENPATLTADEIAQLNEIGDAFTKGALFTTMGALTSLGDGWWSNSEGTLYFSVVRAGGTEISFDFVINGSNNGYWASLRQTEWQKKLTFDSSPTSGSTNPVTSGGVYAALGNKQDTLTFDNNPTANSNNVVKSGGVYTALQGKKNAESTDIVLYFGLTKAALISALNGSSEDNPVTLSGTALEKWNELIADVTDEKRTWTYAFQPVAVNYNDASNRGVTFMGGVTSNNQEPILWEFHKDGNNYWMTRTTVSYAKTSDLTSKQDTLTWATTSDIDDMML